VAAVGSALALAALVYYGGVLGGTAAPPAVRQLSFENGQVGGARFRGRDIVYGAAWDEQPFFLYTTSLDSYQSRRLPDISAADLLAVSGATAALSLGREAGTGWFPMGVLARVDLSGGSPRELDDGILAADFSPDGEIAALVRLVGNGTVLEFPAGTVVRNASLISNPRVSADGTEACFTENYAFLMRAERGVAAKPVTLRQFPRIASCAFSPDGTEIWFAYSPTGGTHTALAAIRRDGSGFRILTPLTSYALIRDVSADGNVLISAGSLRFSVRGQGRQNDRELDLGVFDASRLLYLSGSGDTALMFDNSSGSAGLGTLFLKRLGPEPPTPVGAGNALAVTPSGDAIVLISQQPGPSVLTLAPVGIGPTRTITLDVTVNYAATNSFGTSQASVLYPDFSVDGSRLLLPYATDASGTARAYVYDFTEDRLLPATPPGVTGPLVLSPDGRHVASNGAAGLIIYTVGSDETRTVPGGADGRRPVRWSTDDEFVYEMGLGAAGGSLYRRSVVTGQSEFLRDIRVADVAGITRVEPWVSRDGQAYAFGLDRMLTNLYVLENVH
jgi:hypothetical protein